MVGAETGELVSLVSPLFSLLSLVLLGFGAAGWLLPVWLPRSQSCSIPARVVQLLLLPK